jgi:hypothetical protein
MTAQTERDQTHNGWKNFPTWAVNLWLENDEGLHNATREIVGNVAQEARTADQVVDGIWTVEQATRYNVADALRTWVQDELAPDLGASFAADLLGYALDEVDWDEVADAWIEQV